MKSPKLPAKGKARVMYETAHRRGGTIILHTRTEPEDVPVAVASLSPEAEEARVEAGAKALNSLHTFSRWSEKRGWHGCPWRKLMEQERNRYRAKARAVLASAGLLAGGKKGAK